MTTLQTVFVLLAAGLVLFWLVLAASGPRKSDPAHVIAVLRYGSVLRTAALVLALAPPLVMAFAIAAFYWKTQGQLALAGSLFVVTSLVAALLFLEIECADNLVTEEAITAFSPW